MSECGQPAPQIEIDGHRAGGGSIAYLDPASQTGPRSPARLPVRSRRRHRTDTTDANVVLGRCPDLALGGEIKLDEDAAMRAVSTLGDELDSRQSASRRHHSLAVARMTATVKEISVMRGLDLAISRFSHTAVPDHFTRPISRKSLV